MAYYSNRRRRGTSGKRTYSSRRRKTKRIRKIYVSRGGIRL